MSWSLGVAAASLCPSWTSSTDVAGPFGTGPGVDAAVEWLKDKHTHVALVAVDEIWRDLVARLQTSANCGRIIIASQGYLPIAEVLSAGVHYTLRVPLNAYDLRWTVVTACREARSETEQSRSFQ